MAAPFRGTCSSACPRASSLATALCREHMMCPLFGASDLSALLPAAGQSVGGEADHALSASGPGAGHDDSRGRAASHEWRDQLDSGGRDHWLRAPDGAALALAVRTHRL